jgi:hypothetical protein
VIGGSTRDRPYDGIVRTACTVVLGCFLIAGSVAANNPPLQRSAVSVVPTWKNLETWSRFDAANKETEVGLGLQPPDNTGGASIAFWVKLPGKGDAAPANQVFVSATLGPNVSPYEIRGPSMTFLLDEGKPKWTALDLTGRAVSDEQVPSYSIRSSIARMTPDEFLQLTRARAIKANMLRTELTLTSQQIDALRAFARRILPPNGR